MHAYCMNTSVLGTQLREAMSMYLWTDTDNYVGFQCCMWDGAVVRTEANDTMDAKQHGVPSYRQTTLKPYM